jgi:rubredoxin
MPDKHCPYCEDSEGYPIGMDWEKDKVGITWVCPVCGYEEGVF